MVVGLGFFLQLHNYRSFTLHLFYKTFNKSAISFDKIRINKIRTCVFW